MNYEQSLQEGANFMQLKVFQKWKSKALVENESSAKEK